jgi:AcrR family transcriptional regulator
LSTINSVERPLLNKTPKLSNTAPLERKTDRRVSRTRRQLRESLFSLILEKGFEAVTIEDITQRADLGRTTFYLHYHDKEDLLMESIGELVEDLIAQMSGFPPERWRLEDGTFSQTPSPAITLPFQHVTKNVDLYRIILRGEGSYTVSRRMRAIIVQACETMIGVLLNKEQLAALHPQAPMEIILNFLAGAWLGLVTWWLENDMPYTEGEMALMFQKLILYGTADVLGVSPQGPDKKL